MTPQYFLALAFVLLVCLAGYGIHRASASDIPAVLVPVVRALVALVLGSLALPLADPAAAPEVVHAVMSRL